MNTKDIEARAEAATAARNIADYIDALLAQLVAEEKTLAAVEEYASEMDRDDCVIELFRILKGGA